MSNTRTVLVVEDDPNLRDAIELLLLRKGYYVVATGDGLRALELAGQHPIDAALVDLLIPGQSGFQVLAELKALHGDDVKVALMSGTAPGAHRDYAFAAGADQFLDKPFTVARLLETVAELCPPPESPPAGARRTVRIG
jgi:DNA-binding response OmpR family regulator